MMLKWLIALTMILAMPAVAAAQSWSDPDRTQLAAADDTDRMDQMIDELEALMDKAENQRLADPWFIQDVRDVLRKYDWPWSRTVYQQRFDQPSRMPPEPWQVRLGQFRVDGTLGMRSIVYPEPQRQTAETDSGSGSSGEAFGKLIGEILKQSLDEDGQRQEEPADQGPVEAAIAVAPISTPNAFALRLRISIRPMEGRGAQALAIGPYQGEDAVAGYRLVYRPSPGQGVPPLALMKRSFRGTVSTIEIYEGDITLDDSNVHEVLWTRDSRGQMQVSIDGTVVMETVDRGFNDPFRGIVIRNEGGDYAIREMVLQGAG